VFRRTEINSERAAGWRDSENVCALSDGDRHLGHILRSGGQWKAFDATHLNRRRTGFLALGIFTDRQLAKAAVESSCATGGRAMAAGSFWIS
jgi:hypothetical protein